VCFAQLECCCFYFWTDLRHKCWKRANSWRNITCNQDRRTSKEETSSHGLPFSPMMEAYVHLKRHSVSEKTEAFMGSFVRTSNPTLVLKVSHWMRCCCFLSVARMELEELQFFLRPTVSRPVRLGIGPPFGTLDQILACSSFSVGQLLFFLLSKSPSLTRKRVCSLQCNHSLVRLLTPNNHTLPSHLRLCSLFVASYDSQVLRWRYSNPPPHWVARMVFM
jgi:hypothetical protein